MTKYSKKKNLFAALLWAVNEELCVSESHVESLKEDPVKASGDNDWILDGLNHIEVMLSFISKNDSNANNKDVAEELLAVVRRRKEIIETAIRLKEEHDKLNGLFEEYMD